MKLEITFSDKEKKIIEQEEDLIRHTIDKFEKEKFPKYVSNYKQYLGYTLDRLREIESWQTNINYPLASAIIDTQFANLFDFNYVFGILEVEMRNLLDETFDYNSQGKNCLKNMLKEALICGESFSKVGLMKRKEVYTLLMGKHTEDIITKKPIISYLSIFNLFYDLSHGLEKSPYTITRTFNTGKYIQEKFCYLFSDKKKHGVSDLNITAFINTILKAPKSNRRRFSNYDFNPVKRINDFSNILVKSYNNKSPLHTGMAMMSDEINNVDINNFYLVDQNKSYEIVEYLSGDIYSVYIDGLLLYRGKPVLDIGVKLINGISFNEVPGTGSANGQIDNLAHMQGVLNSIWNGFLDNMKMQLSGMFAVYGNVPGINKDGKIRFEKFKGIKMSPDSRIERIDLGLNDFSPLNVLQFVEGITEKRGGANSYLLGGQSKVERVSNSIDLIHDQYKSKLTPIIDSVQIMMGSVAKAWMLMYLAYFSKEELEDLGLTIKIENKQLFINEHPIKHILNDEHISFKFNSLRNIEKEKKRGIIKEIFMSLIQVKQFAPSQIDELFKVLLDEDFDLDTFTGFGFAENEQTILGEGSEGLGSVMPEGLGNIPGLEGDESLLEGESIDDFEAIEEDLENIAF